MYGDYCVCNIAYFYTFVWGPQWHSGLSDMLHIGRPLVRSQMVSLEFFIDIILPIALWPWGGLSL